MKVYRTSILGALALSMIIGLISCASTPKVPDHSLVGTWMSKDGTGIGFEFTSDGKMYQVTGSAKQQFIYEAANGIGKYWLEGMKIGSTKMVYVIKDGELTFTLKSMIGDTIYNLVKAP